MRTIITKTDLTKAALLTGLAFVTLYGVPTIASANPVECSRANKPAEYAVCNNEDLIYLDEQLQRLHRQKLAVASTKPQVQAVKKERMRWVAKRNACKADTSCLKTRYQLEIIEQNGNLVGFSD